MDRISCIRKWLLVVLLLGVLGMAGVCHAQKVLIPMDLTQTDHLKAYGVAYWVLQHGINVEWLLNYRDGSFLMDAFPELERECRLRVHGQSTQRKQYSKDMSAQGTDCRNSGPKCPPRERAVTPSDRHSLISEPGSDAS